MDVQANTIPDFANLSRVEDGVCAKRMHAREVRVEVSQWVRSRRLTRRVAEERMGEDE
jgi:hypothetical protein